MGRDFIPAHAFFFRDPQIGNSEKLLLSSSPAWRKNMSCLAGIAGVSPNAA